MASPQEKLAASLEKLRKLQNEEGIAAIRSKELSQTHRERLLKNVMLASGGYPWTVLPVEERDEYMQSLEEASTSNNISRFAKFIAHHVEEGLKGKPVANLQSE